MAGNKVQGRIAIVGGKCNEGTEEEQANETRRGDGLAIRLCDRVQATRSRLLEVTGYLFAPARALARVGCFERVQGTRKIHDDLPCTHRQPEQAEDHIADHRRNEIRLPRKERRVGNNHDRRRLQTEQ